MSFRLPTEGFRVAGAGAAGGGGGAATSLAPGCTGADLVLSGALTAASIVSQGDLTSQRDASEGGAQAIAAATDTIVATHSLLRLTNTPATPITLTSTPTIATAGVPDGTVLTLEHVTTGNIVLQDLTVLPGSKLRLVSGANKTLSGRDYIVLQYNQALDEWKQLGAVSLL